MDSMDLATLLKEARINEEKLISLQAMEAKLLDADNFYEVCRILIEDYRRQFNLLSVSLTLIDRGRQMMGYLTELEEGNPDCELSKIQKNLFFEYDYQTIERLRTQMKEPVLGKMIPEHDVFFGEHAQDIESMVLLPLVRKGELIGVLGFGSVDPERYTEDMGAEFLKRLSLVVAVCVQNAIQVEHLRLIGLVDDLTQMRNRSYFYKRLLQEVKRAQRQEQTLSCLMLSIDGMADIISEYGHVASDIVVMHCSNLIHQAVRGTDISTRISDASFGIIASDTSSEGVMVLANRLQGLFNETQCELNRATRLGITVSMGMATSDLSQIVAEAGGVCADIVERAERATAVAQKQTGNTISADSD